MQNATEPAIFYTQRQFPFRKWMFAVVRGLGAPVGLTSAVRDTVLRRVDAGLPLLSQVRPLERVIGDTAERPRNGHGR